MSNSPWIELRFPVVGNQLAVDHAYLLYSALSETLPLLHDKQFPVAISSIPGQSIGSGKQQITDRSHLRFRLPSDRIPAVLSLAGKALRIGDHSLRLGVPSVQVLEPTAALIARLVTIKGFTEPASFLDAVRRQLDELNIAGEAGIPVVTSGPHQGKPLRRVIHIKDKRVVGFALQVAGLTAEDSIKLQEHGIGGRRRMGCGFFVPMREKERQR